MNVFRLVLCLAGLAAYLVVKQWLHSSPFPSTLATAGPAASPSAAPPLPASHQAHMESSPDAKAHTEVVKVGHDIEDRK
jgi:hypothetical protein